MILLAGTLALAGDERFTLPPPPDAVAFPDIQKRRAFAVARRVRIGGLAMLGGGIGGSWLAFSLRNEGTAGLALVVLAAEIGVPVVLYGATSWIIGRVLEDRLLRDVDRPKVAGVLAPMLIGASVGAAVLGIKAELARDLTPVPYGWVWAGLFAGGIALDVAQMSQNGHPYGDEPDLVLVPTPTGLAVAARF
jgi:hypothetical protein